MNLTDLDTFLRVADAGSFTKAAAQLGVPKSTVSRRVTRLEDSLGLPLLARKARSFTITEHGRLLHARCGPALEEIEQVEQILADASAEPTGVVRVTGPTDLSTTSMFSEFLADFRRRWPKIELDLELTARRVDLIEEGIDVAFRAHRQPLPDTTTLMARTLRATTAGVFASPEYLARAGTIRSPQNLADRDCLSLRGLRGAWPLQRGASGEHVSFPVRSVLTANEFSVLYSAAVQGVGVALLPCFGAEPFVEAEELVRVLPRWRAASGALSLVWPRSRFPSPRVRAFIDAAAEAFR